MRKVVAVGAMGEVRSEAGKGHERPGREGLEIFEKRAQETVSSERK